MTVFSQEKDSLNIVTVDSVAIKNNLRKEARIAKREARRIKNQRPYDALAPSKAAFYSAILPGLGQAYTGKYWKIPIVYTALGTGIGIALWNQNNYNELRDAYRNRLLGINTDRYYIDNDEDGIVDISNEDLANAFEGYQKQKEIAILVTVGLYVLNIIDANVTAHLQQFNLNKELTFEPKVDFDHQNKLNYGMSLNYNF